MVRPMGSKSDKVGNIARKAAKKNVVNNRIPVAARRLPRYIKIPAITANMLNEDAYDIR